MNEYATVQATQHSFKEFLFNNRRIRIILWLATIAIIIQLVTFKYLYPFASFIHGDSFSYINAAYQNSDINTYMIGYSRFLRLFSVFFTSDISLIIFQYLFIQSSALFLLFTIFYFYEPSKVTQYILLLFMVFNPLFLHLANLISSDCLFTALSLTWFALLLWIIHQPSNGIIMWQALVLSIAFTVRYNALIYPFITALAFCLSPLPLRRKLGNIGIGLLLCGLFVCYTSYKYEQLTSYWQYSPFSGWQLTNNAMYAYRYVDSSERKPVPKKFKVLDNMVREYFDSTRDTKKYPVETLQASTVYMWDPKLTLYLYRDRLFKKDTSASELKKWASMGPLYKAYGLYIIKQYPWYFARYFIWPNANKYYAPPVEFLESYNSWKDFVSPQTKAWFGYKSQKVKTNMKDNKVWVLDFYPILSGVISVMMLCSLLCFWLLKGWQYNTLFRKGILLSGTIWLLNAVFTIWSSSAALRFQSFPILLSIIFVVLMINWMVQLMSSMRQEIVKSNNDLEKVGDELQKSII